MFPMSIFRASHWKQATTDMDRAKEICDRCGRPYYLSGIAYLAAFHLSKEDQYLPLAENEFMEVIHRNPNGLGTYLMLGKIKSLQGNIDEARNFYEKARKDSRFRGAAVTGINNLEKNRGGVNPESSSILKMI